MAFFKFSATDAGGRVISGTLQAESEAQVRQRLSEQGLRAEWVGRPPSGGAATAPKPTAPSTIAPRPTAPGPTATPSSVPRPPQPRPAPAQQVSPQQIAAPRPVMPAAPKLSHPNPNLLRHGIRPKTAYFLFEQMSSFVRSGTGVQQMLATLSGQQRNVRLGEALRDMAARTAEGKSLADAMAMHPDVFPIDMVGMVRAGEVGGFLPEALQDVSATAHSAHRLTRGFLYVSVVFCVIVFITPGIRAIQIGAFKSMELQDKAGGTLPPVATLVKCINENLTWSIPVSAAALAVVIGFYKLWNLGRFRMFRQQLVLMTPLLRQRAVTEAARRFALAMTGISRAGITPFTAYRMAADAIPNDVVRQQVVERCHFATEQTKLSEMMSASRIFDHQYQMMIQNGEMIGDVPGMMSKIAESEAVNTESRDNVARGSLGFAALLAIAAMVTFTAGYLYTLYGQGLIQTILKDN